MSVQWVPEQNPMLNHVVLERIFKLVEFDKTSFANYRLVSKSWYDVSLPIWRNNAWLHAKTCHQGPGVDVEDYLKLLKSDEHRLAAVPFRKYKIRLWDGVIHDNKGNPEKLEFWKTVGPLMTHLDINSSNFYTAENVRKVMFQLTPNLQSLTLGRNTYITYDIKKFYPTNQKGLGINEHLTHFKFHGDQEGTFPISWVEILLRFPNIENLEHPGGLFDILRGNFKVVKDAEGFSREAVAVDIIFLKKLAVLKSNSFTLEYASLLKRLQLPLKVLALDIGSEREDGNEREALQMVLESHAETLQELRLRRVVEFFPFKDFPFGINFPKLNKFSSTIELVQNLDFLKQMPNLEYLFLEKEDEEIRLCRSESSINLEAHVNMKELNIANKFCCEREVIFLSNVMPNLTKISIGLKKTYSFKAICLLWKDVTDLKIYTRDEKEDAYWKSDEGNKVVQANISILKELRVLKFGKFIEQSE